MVDEKSILFIDDEEIICETVSDDLDEVGYSITTATSGEEGIQKFKSGHFDLVITDLIMEGKSGLDVVQEIKSVQPETSVIILTGHGTMETAIKALQLEAQDYILKPIKRDDFLRKIEKNLSKRRQNGSKSNIKPTYKQKLKFNNASLTSREREVGHLAAEGFNDNEIAQMLDISIYTVKFHLKKVFKKLNIHKRVELIVSLGKKRR